MVAASCMPMGIRQSEGIGAKQPHCRPLQHHKRRSDCGPWLTLASSMSRQFLISQASQTCGLAGGCHGPAAANRRHRPCALGAGHGQHAGQQQVCIRTLVVGCIVNNGW